MARQRFIDPVGTDEYDAGLTGDACVNFIGGKTSLLASRQLVLVEGTGTPNPSEHPNKINEGNLRWFNDEA
jgi:hypothetical protein